MPEVNLSEAYLHAGKVYGPGENIEVPEDFELPEKEKENQPKKASRKKSSE